MVEAPSALDRQTEYLFERLQEIEYRTEEMRRESERLRMIKDEAKAKVVKQFPHLFTRRDRKVTETAEGFANEFSVASSSYDDDDDLSR